MARTGDGKAIYVGAGGFAFCLIKLSSDVPGTWSFDSSNKNNRCVSATARIILLTRLVFPFFRTRLVSQILLQAKFLLEGTKMWVVPHIVLSTPHD